MRKTQAQRNQDFREAERRVWDEFRPKLKALDSFVKAQLLVADAPPPDSPGRRYYSNLGFFLQSFAVLTGSSYSEKEMYLQFIQRLEANGVLNPGAGATIVENLRQAMATQGPMCMCRRAKDEPSDTRPFYKSTFPVRA